MPELAVEIDGSETSGLPRFHTTLSRVNVILGANGSGKSKLIKQIRDDRGSLAAGRSVVYVEGGRVVEPPKSVGLNRRNINQFQDLGKASTRYSTRREQNKLSERISELFVLLDRRGERIRREHSDAVQEWIDRGQPNNPPDRDDLPLELLFERFHEIFPSIQLTVDPDSREIACHQGGATYQPSDLSDGERQVLALLADVAILSDPNSLVLVDEPELNLNTQLACRLWDSIEAELPDSIFVYATHSLGFAMRGNIDKVLILSSPEDDPVEISDPGALVSEDIRPFLGAIPAILAAPAALVVEGKESSLDSIFYEWLLADKQQVVVPVGSCENVLAAAQRTGVWEKLAPDAAVYGVVDRDFRSDEALERYATDGCKPLQLHEVESYLCVPNLICDLGEAIGLIEEPPSPDEVRDEIVDFCQERRVGIVARRVFAQLEVSLGVSLPKRVLERVESREALLTQIQDAAERERRRAEQDFTDEEIEQTVRREWRRLDDAISARDVDRLLSLGPGKPLLSRLGRQIGCHSHTRIARSASRNLNVADYEPLRTLRETLRDGLRHNN